MKSKRYFPILIDIVTICIGLFNLIFTKTISRNATIYFYVDIFILMALYFTSYRLDKKKKINLFYAFAFLIVFLTSMFIKFFSNNMVLACAIAILTISVTLFRLKELKDIYENKFYLFYIYLTRMSVTILVSLLVCINLYFKISTIASLIGFYFLSIGIINIVPSILIYILEKLNIIKVRKPIKRVRRR